MVENMPQNLPDGHLVRDRPRQSLIGLVWRYAAVMGITWLLDVPARIRAGLGPDPGELSPRDPRIAGDESLRAPLQMLANLLNLWATRAR